jgi:hypothetical protein
MLNAQAQVLFARGETEKAIQLQNEAVAKAEKTLAKSLENLAKYQGRSGINEPIARKLREIIIPTLAFENTSFEEVIDFLRVRCRELDNNENDPANKGVNFVVVRSRELAKAAPIPEGTPDKGTKDLQIESLRLHNIPLGEALKHICEATGTRFEIDGQVVKIVKGAP